MTSTTHSDGNSSPTKTAAELQRQERRALTDVETRTDQIQVVPLYHGTGTYYIDVWCGTPVPQHQTMIVDTGSSTTAMTCLPDCTPSHCGHVQQYHPVFVPHQSVSFRKVKHCEDCQIGDCVPVTQMSQESNQNNNNNNNKNYNGAEVVVSNTTGEEEFECVWNAAYQEGSNWTAFESTDQCYIGGHHSATPITFQLPSSLLRGRPKGSDNVDNNSTSSTTTSLYSGIDPNMAAIKYQFQLRFGCQTSLYGNFRTQDTSGIIGLNIGSTAIWNQMHQQQIISKRAFSICIQPPSHSGSTYAARYRPSGIMTLGGTHAPIHHHTMIYAQQQHDDIGRGLYMIQLQNIYLCPATSTSPEVSTRFDPRRIQKVSIPDTQDFVRKVIVDSGTTNTYFAAQLDGPFRNAWLELYGTPYTNEPMVLTDEEVKQLPTIVLQFQGHTDSNMELENDPTATEFLTDIIDTDHPYDILLVVPPSIYMEYEHGKYSSSIYFDEPESNVLGANIMTNYDVYFDVELRRIGFAESSCNYTALLELPVNPTVTASHITNTASKLQLQPTFIHDTPSVFFVLAFSIIAFLVLALASRKPATTVHTHATSGTQQVSNIRRGRRRRPLQPQQPHDQQLVHRIRMVVRSISRDRAELSHIMRQPSGSSVSSASSASSSKHSHNPTPARRNQSFAAHHDPHHVMPSTSSDDQEAANTAREGRHGTNVLRSRSYHVPFREDT